MNEDNEKRVIISKQYLMDIGNAIRNKLGDYSKTYKPSEMADAIRSIQTNTFVTSFLHDKSIIYSGNIGGCAWEISSKGVLFIYAGLLPDNCRGICESGKSFVLSENKTDSPWIKYKNNIKLVSFEGPVIAGPNISYLFRGLDKLWLINSMNYLNTNRTTNMASMFQDCKGLAGIDFSVNDFTNVTDMSYIFNNCSRLIEVKFPDINYVDYRCGYSVQNLRGAFTSCVLLDKIDLSFLDEGKNITNMEMIFDNCTALEKITTRFGKLAKLETLAMAFRKCIKLKELDVSNWQTTSTLKNLQETFSTCVLLETIDLSNWDISGVTVLANMFNGCSALGEIKTDKGLMFSKNANVADMFNNCSANLDTKLWDTSEMISFQKFFEGWLGSNELDFSLWDTSNVTNMAYMFNNCPNIIKVNLFSFEPYECTSMEGMFQNCKKLKLSNITFFYDPNSTLKLGSVASMFAGCVEFDEFHFPFSTYKVENYKNMLNGCNKIKIIDFTSWIMGGTEPQKVDAQDMLKNCTNLRTLHIGESYNLNYFRPTVCELKMSGAELIEICTWYCPCFPVYMYENKYGIQGSIQITANQIQPIDEGIPQGVKTYYGIGAITDGSTFNKRIKALVSGVNVSTITNTSGSDSFIKTIIFRTATGTENEEFFNNTEKWMGVGSYPNYAGAYASWDEETQTVTIATGERFCLLNKDSSHMFQRLTALEEIISGALNSQIVASLNSAFENCSSMEYFDFSQWKTPKLIDMANCFNGCISLKEIDLSIFDTSSLSNIKNLLTGAIALKTVTFFDDISHTIYAQEAFANCTNLTTFNASHYVEFVDSDSIKGISMMFFKCETLKTLNLTNWNTSNLRYFTGVFSGCKSLESLNISTWVMNSNVLNMNSMFKDCYELFDLKFWSESPNDGRGWYDYISPMDISEMFSHCRKLGTVQGINNRESGTFIFPRIHLKNTSQVITNASQRAVAQNVLVGCYGIKILDLHNLQIETTLPLNNDNLLEGENIHYSDLSNWTPIVGNLYHLFEHNNDTGVDRFTLTTGGGWEKLYIQLAVQANTEYSWVFNFNAPEGYNRLGSNNLDYYVTGYSNNDWQDQYNLRFNDNYRYRVLATGSLSNKISSQPLEYTLNFNTGNYTQIRLFFNFGGVADNQTKPYEFSNMSLYLNGVNSLPNTTNFVTDQAGRKGEYNLETIITGNILAGFLYNNNTFIARMPSVSNITYTRISNNETYTAIPANTADTYNINYLPEMGEDELGG